LTQRVFIYKNGLKNSLTFSKTNYTSRGVRALTFSPWWITIPRESRLLIGGRAEKRPPEQVLGILKGAVSVYIAQDPQFKNCRKE
jgi:hypothetical protein